MDDLLKSVSSGLNFPALLWWSLFQLLHRLEPKSLEFPVKLRTIKAFGSVEIDKFGRLNITSML